MNKLYNKYIISKTDGSPVDPLAQYFVLRIDTDPAARAALREYAKATSDNKFSKELLDWIDDVERDIDRLATTGTTEE